MRNLISAIATPLHLHFGLYTLQYLEFMAVCFDDDPYYRVYVPAYLYVETVALPKKTSSFHFRTRQAFQLYLRFSTTESVFDVCATDYYLFTYI